VKTIIGLLLIFLSQFFHCWAQEDQLPQRVICLGPAITQEFYLLGLEDKLVGVTSYCIRPLAAQSKQKVGNIVDVNLEEIVALNPDLIFATELTDKKSVDKIKSLGIKVVVLPQPKTFYQLCEQFSVVAGYMGKRQFADEIVAAARKKIESIRAKIPRNFQPKVFIQIGAKPLFTANKDSFVHDMVELAGGVNIGKDCPIGFISRETVIAGDPDYIFIITMGIIGENEKKAWQEFKQMRAVKNNNIFLIDSDKVCSPSPDEFVGQVEEIAGIIKNSDK
jgi:iron complex transport system substrate-binding protein